MPTMITLVDGTIPVAADFNSNYTNLNNAIGSSTAITTYVTGDMLYAGGANSLSRLAIGATDRVLTVSGGLPVWAVSTGGQTVYHLSPVSAAFPTTNFPQLVKNSDTNWTAYTLDYDQTTSEEAFWFFALPTAVPTFTGATCEIWYRTSVTSGTSQWDIETLTRAEGEAWDTNGTTNSSAADTVPGVAQQVGYVSTALTTTGWAAAEVLLVRIARNIADTAAADVKLIHAIIRLT